MACAWMDKKPVMVMSSCCSDPTAMTTVTRRIKDGSKVNVPCPLPVSQYNRFMRGVDRGDQLRGYYKTKTKCRKMYKYIFWFLFDMVITNSYILYKHYRLGTVQTQTIPFKEFRLRLADLLIGDYCSRKRPGRPYAVTQHPPVQLLHVPVKRMDGGEGDRTKRSKCLLCTRNKKRKDTCWNCKGCNIPLCFTGFPNDCFTLWHKKIDHEE